MGMVTDLVPGFHMPVYVSAGKVHGHEHWNGDLGIGNGQRALDIDGHRNNNR